MQGENAWRFEALAFLGVDPKGKWRCDRTKAWLDSDRPNLYRKNRIAGNLRVLEKVPGPSSTPLLEVFDSCLQGLAAK